MELTVAKKDLSRLVQRMQGVAERKSTMPVLANVLITSEGGNEVRLAATDLYLSLHGKVHATVTKPGSVAVSARDLAERVKNMPEGMLTLSSMDNASTTLKAAGSARRYTLRGMPGDDFPPLPSPAEGAPSLALDAAVLSDLISKTQFSVSTDETRAHLNSALFEWDGEVVRMVSTDGHRLSKYDVTLAGRQASSTMLIPLKAVTELKKLADEILADPTVEKKELLVTQSGASAFFQGGGTTFSVKLVDAQFPPYAQVIPAQSERVVRAPRLALADALRAVSVAASERTGGVKLSLSKGTLRITSESPESGEGFDELPVDYSGAAMSIGFNAKYFLDVLGALDGFEEIELSLSGELDPAVVRPAGASAASDRQFLAVVMPMRI